VKDPQRYRIAAAFDRELARSPLPADLRAQAVHYALNSGDSYERQRPLKMLALVAALLAVAIVVTLMFAAHSLRSRQIVPANPIVPTNPIPIPKAGPPLAPGTYFLANPYLGNNPPLNCNRGCADYKRIIFTLPAGWAISNGLVYKHLNQPGEVAFSAWTVDQVYDDPCHWQGSTLSPLDIAYSSYDAATGRLIPAPHAGGLANQALRGPLPRALTPVTLASIGSGGSGPVIALRIDLSVPAGLDISTCDKGQFRSWTVWEVVDGADSHYAPGQLDAVYMVDVDRRALVIDASHMPATSATDLAELKAILASMIIDRG
jgi:hypothetical protein